MLGEGNKSITTGVYGWETVEEEMLLIELARKFVPDDGTIVELGTEYGRSISEFIYATKEKIGISIYAIDLFPENHQVVGDLLTAWKSNIKEAFNGIGEDHLGTLTFNNYTTITPIQHISWEASDNFQNIDLLFIDAGHSYEEVRNDIFAWHQKVKEGGLIIFHDYAQNEQSHYLHLEVKRAVDEFYEANKEDYEFHQGVDSIVYMVKKKKEIIQTELEEKPVEKQVKPKGRPKKQ